MENITKVYIENKINGKSVLKDILVEDDILNIETSEGEMFWNTILIVSAYMGMGTLLLFKLVESIIASLM